MKIRLKILIMGLVIINFLHAQEQKELHSSSKTLANAKDALREDRDRLEKWKRVGISLPQVVSRLASLIESASEDEDEEEADGQTHTIEETIQEISDQIQRAVQLFERTNQVKVEILTSTNRVPNVTEDFIAFMLSSQFLRTGA